MPSVLPATGTAIAMGRVRNAYGLSGATRLRADLGAQIGSGSVSSFKFSVSFGGKTAPGTY